jgi:hypothetical protein
MHDIGTMIYNKKENAYSKRDSEAKRTGPAD